MNNRITGKEYLELNKVLEKKSNQLEEKVTLNYLVKKWENFVFSCESGYKECFDEYINDVSIREVLFEITENVSENLSKKIQDILNPIDKKFLLITNPIQKPLISSFNQKKKVFGLLYLRIPKNLSGELKEDLSNMNLNNK